MDSDAQRPVSGPRAFWRLLGSKTPRKQTSALEQLTDSSRTLRQVPKVPNSDMIGTWPAREPGALLLGMKVRRASAVHLWYKSPVGIGAKIAQAAAGRRSSNTATRQRRARRVNNRKSFSFSSEAFAGMRITYRHQKEAQPEGQHDDIQHEMLLVALVSGRDGCAFPGRKIAMDQEQ
jgi:hypothetical protein